MSDPNDIAGDEAHLKDLIQRHEQLRGWGETQQEMAYLSQHHSVSDKVYSLSRIIFKMEHDPELQPGGRHEILLTLNMKIVDT